MNKTHRNTPLQRSPKDLIATAVITTVALTGITVAWAAAPIRHSELTPAEQPFESPVVLAALPSHLRETWRAADSAVPALVRPLVVDGLVITANGGTVSAMDPHTGQPVWTYTRDLEVCSLGLAFNSVVATYRNSAGCGDVTRIDAKQGTYEATRSAPAPDHVVPLASNDRVGTVSPERVELWRSDLVRTVEYGDKTAKQEPNQQPHEACTISSALSRKELLAVAETCPEQPDNTMLRFLSSTPDDSREPTVKADVSVPGSDAQLIGVGQKLASVYVPSSTPQLISYDDTGKEKSRLAVKPSRLVAEHLSSDTATAFAPETADLPHHMTWFDGERLYLLNPATLATEVIFEGAIGTGAAVGDRIAFPIPGGIAVGNWSTGKVEKTIPVDRKGYTGRVSLAVAGTTVVEKRGDAVVILRG